MTTFDPSIKFDDLAVTIANIAYSQLFPCRFGVAPLSDWPMLNGATAIFSNCGYSQDEPGPLAVKAFRECLAQEQVEELGFGISTNNGYSWAIIIDSLETEYWLDRAREAWYAASASVGVLQPPGAYPVGIVNREQACQPTKRAWFRLQDKTYSANPGDAVHHWLLSKEAVLVNEAEVPRRSSGYMAYRCSEGCGRACIGPAAIHMMGYTCLNCRERRSLRVA